jgi:hypothetical protein
MEEQTQVEATRAKTPEQLFVEFLQQHGLVAEAYAVAPTGDAINARAYLPAGWRLLVNVVEAKKNGV